MVTKRIASAAISRVTTLLRRPGTGRENDMSPPPGVLRGEAAFFAI